MSQQQGARFGDIREGVNMTLFYPVREGEVTKAIIGSFLRQFVFFTPSKQKMLLRAGNYLITRYL